MPRKPQERLVWVDYARIPAMLSVIFQHIPYRCGWNDPILSASLAFFMILAGYFAAPKLASASDGWDYAKRRFKHLAIPYIFWSIVYGVAVSPLFYSESTLTWSLASCTAMLGLAHEPLLVPMWFVRDLMVFFLVGWVLMRWPSLLPLGLAGLFFLPFGESPEMWPKPHMLGNFCLGMMLARFPDLPERWKLFPVQFHVLLIAAWVGLLILRACGGLWKSFIYAPLTPLGVVALLSLGIVMQSMPICRVVWKSFAQGTFFVFCVHIFFIGILQAKLSSESPWWIAAAFAIYLASQAVYIGLKRFKWLRRCLNG